ncbi:MAG TPA: DUF4434 domain-containing protein [Candidatus Hydrogenedentes bacterium]|nr:DUF4434 domain-containing protein [Candidatus Hydrogenedentota bacterium]HQM47553.1 DUF4434 domain-containing protein [Candidatus Hydrogenedentota bacterium]
MRRREFLKAAAVTGALAGAVQGEESKETEAKPLTIGTEPVITGSFFDLTHVNIFDAAYWTDTCRFWGADNWRALMRDMRGIGIDTAICVSTASWGRPLFPGYEKTVGLPVKFGCEDPLRVCVDEAETLGMTIFLGVGFRGRVSQVRDYAGMEPPWPEVWFTWNRALAEALVEQYGARKNFGGLYMAYEMDFEPYQIDLYEKFMSEYLRPALGNVKVLASPGNLGDHPNLAEAPGQLKRAGIDIVAPQDYGGRTGSIDEALALVRKNADALRQAGPALRANGIEVWANCEAFNLEPNPSGRSHCVPGSMERIRQQLALQAPVADKLICYQYQGIMNRKTDLVMIGHPDTQKLYDAYLAYLEERNRA